MVTVIELMGENHTSEHTIELEEMSVDVIISVESTEKIDKGDYHTPDYCVRTIHSEEIQIIAAYNEDGSIIELSDEEIKLATDKIKEQIIYN